MRRGTAAPTAHFLATPSGAPLTTAGKESWGMAGEVLGVAGVGQVAAGGEMAWGLEGEG